MCIKVPVSTVTGLNCTSITMSLLYSIDVKLDRYNLDVDDKKFELYFNIFTRKFSKIKVTHFSNE